MPGDEAASELRRARRQPWRCLWGSRWGPGGEGCRPLQHGQYSGFDPSWCYRVDTDPAGPQYVGEAPGDCKESRLAGGVGDDQELTDVGSVLTILTMLPPAARRRPCRETERARAHAELSILKQITEAANGSWRLPPGTLSAHIRKATGRGRARTWQGLQGPSQGTAGDSR